MKKRNGLKAYFGLNLFTVAIIFDKIVLSSVAFERSDYAVHNAALYYISFAYLFYLVFDKNGNHRTGSNVEELNESSKIDS